MTSLLNLVDKEKAAAIWEGASGKHRRESLPFPSPHLTQLTCLSALSPGHLPPEVRKAETTLVLDDKPQLIQACTDCLRTHICHLHLIFIHWLAKLVSSFWSKVWNFRFLWPSILKQTMVWPRPRILPSTGSVLSVGAWRFKGQDGEWRLGLARPVRTSNFLSHGEDLNRVL